MERRISARRPPIPTRLCSIWRQNKLGVPKDKLSVKDGIVSGGGKSISYGDLVKNQQLKLTIPVKGDLTSIMGLTIEGDPPMKPVSEYTVIGKSFKNSVISSKVAAKETWATDVRLPGHVARARGASEDARLDSRLRRSSWTRRKFPNSQVIVKGNLVGVVAPTEWEAIQAAEQVAGSTRSGRSGRACPATQNSTSICGDEADWTTAPVEKSEANKGDVGAGARVGHKKLSATYQLPLHEARADRADDGRWPMSKPDGTVHIHTHNQNPQALRGEIAMMLRTTPDHVIVHAYPGPGHYGRSNGGNAGAEDEAVILSQAVGKPVRVQWMRADDMQWSTQSPAAFSDVQIAHRRKGQDRRVSDRPLHARHAGRSADRRGARRAAHHAGAAMSTSDFVTSTVNSIADPWVYAQVPNVVERGHGTFQVGQKASPTRRRSARPQHAHAGAVPAELSARTGDQRGGGARGRGCHPVPHRPRKRRARHRRAESGARRFRLGHAPFAASGCCGHGINAGARPRSFADAAQRNLLGVRLPDRRHSRARARSWWRSTRSRSIPASSSTRCS